MNNKPSTPVAWNKKKEKLQDRYPERAEEGLVYHKGNEEQHISHLQEKLNKPEGEIKRIIKSL